MLPDKNKKLVGIVSYNIHSNHLNYGTVLHSYAFQQYLKRHGVESVILDFVPPSLEHYHVKWPFLNNVRFWHIRSFLFYMANWIFACFDNLSKFKKFQSFFDRCYVKTAKEYRTEQLKKMDSLEELQVDLWVCESDVIWKLYTCNGFFDVFFLNTPFMNKSKKVAYSPCLGSKKFNKDEVLTFKYLTQTFSAISCRERKSVEYVQRILNREVSFVLDPTLLLSSDIYDRIVEPPKYRKYLLCYNCMSNDKEMLREAKKLADRLGLQLIELSIFSINRMILGHKVVGDAGIEEFLGYMKFADFVVCNSFHGACFCKIYKKQFFVFERDKSDVKMHNLVETFGVIDRMIPCDNKHIPEVYSPIDYGAVEENIRPVLDDSIQFINKYIISQI
ncbi:polysaccharide pyruvyl transferase family protein [Phocaeicola sartorii]|uniref:polysaccharide pyruvyl transferase family protein n=1 Tax=Phocaeicola sartorii TaxID=671267 RepID=UPI00248A949D|nr:polysaccharide pyruvyl transferase family protein [Phocaeicola sartorii]